MKQVWKIFKRDLRRLSHNFAALLVIGGVCLLPSLYAWFNIAANMDPYENTQGILVAVANRDQGASEDGISLHAGDSIVENLKENEQLGWVFVTKDEAVDGVKSGEYYAAIVIPEDFSESLLSILSGDVKQPELDYYINEKKNAIAPKITDTGATTLQQQINDTFCAVASEAISEEVSTTAANLTVDVDSTNSELLASVKEVRENLSEYEGLLTDFEGNVDKANDEISKAKETLNQVKKSIRTVSNTLDQSEDFLTQSRLATGTFSSQISDTLSNGEVFLNNAYIEASRNLSGIESKTSQAAASMSGGITELENIQKQKESLLSQLSDLNQQLGNDSELSAKIAQQIADIQKQNAELDELLASLKSGSEAVGNIADQVSDTTASLQQQADSERSVLQSSKRAVEQTAVPQISQSLDGIASVSGSLKTVLGGLTPTINQLNTMLTQLADSLDDSKDMLSRTGTVLEKVDKQLADVEVDIRALQSSETYQDLLALEGLDADAISDFMESPVDIKSNVMYDVENYGSGMTPFYTNLALWVGGLILVSILKQEVDRDGAVRDFTPTGAYFGRWLLFVVLGVIQGFIVCVGDLVLLKVQCLHPVLFVVTGMICSFIYVNLIYALAITFKHIGKALAVLLVILQIPGSSGTYPIEMMPDFFQNLCPFLPFTYSIRAERECVAGFYGDTYIRNMAFLLIFLGVAFFIGLGLRPILMNLNHLFDRRLSETELMVGETATAYRNKPQLQQILRALLQNEDTKREFMVRSGRFEVHYKGMIRFGFAAILFVPLGFLILSFSLESKLVFLVLAILSLIALALYLIIVEYIHDRILHQLELGGLTVDELMKKLQEENT